MSITLGCAFLVAVMVAAPAAQTPPQSVVAGRNVNMVSGTTLPKGDPFLQRQNEPSVAVSTRNPLHMLAGANDYRLVDVPGMIDDTETGDAWLGVFKSFDGGQRWQSTVLPGNEWLGPSSSPLYGYAAGADPVVRAGAHGLFFYSGLVFDRGTETTTGKSAVFVSRYIDNNNLETGDPITYVGTSIVASDPGATGRFLDKPWMAVDIPRLTAYTCHVPATATTLAQDFPTGVIYIAYTAITTTQAGITSDILLSRSTNCGATWSIPVRVSRPQDTINQGATIAIDPATGNVYVAWRRLAAPGSSDSDAFLVAKSTNEGRKFSTPGVARRFPRGRKVGLSLERYFEHQSMMEATETAEIAEFDQGTSASWLSFRTNAYPTMTFDDQGRLYMAWAERGYGARRPGETEGDARIVMATTMNGTVFTAPRPVDETGQPGHQIMPTLTFANGRLLLVYYDLREDVSGVFSPYIDDKSALYSANRRHSIDLRATTAAPAHEPEFAPSTQVSHYMWGTKAGETGPPRQLQLNVPNLPLFKQGTVPFIGDYIDVAAAPSMVQGADGRWQFNTAAGTSPVFHGVWTDNRDVKPPVSTAGGKPDWSKYTQPTQPTQPTLLTQLTQRGSDPLCDTGTRNQNIYTARLTTGLIAGSPGNTKPLTMAFPRSFVVYAQNTTDQLKYFRLTIANQPAGGRASFLEYPVPPYAADAPPPLTQLDVAVPRRSLVARTVYATSTDPHARINVDVAEIAGEGAPAPMPDGLRAAVVLNPDIENPDIENPDIENPDPSNPDIENAEVHNPDIENAVISNPDIENPDIENPDIENPDIENPDIENPDLSNPDIENPDIENPDIENPDIENPDIENPDIENGTVTDITWTVTNKGNTTTAFDVKLFFSTLTELPPEVALQLILYRVYKTPVANGCALKEQTHNVLVANILNPDIENPDIENAPPQAAAMKGSTAAGAAAAPDSDTPTLWIEPDGVAKITLRIYDKKRDDANKIELTEIKPEIKAQPKNTEDLPAPEKEPPSATPAPAPDVPLLAFTVQPVAAPAGDTLPEVVVSVSSGAAGVPVALAFADNPAGASLTGTTIVETDGAGLAHFSNLHLTKEGSGFRLAASATSIDAVPALSVLFNADPPSTIVRNTNDSGLGSLRQAILNANARPGADAITFNIPAGPYTIAPLTALPAITEPVTIDATSQPGWTGTPVVELNGAFAGAGADGLRITAGGSTVRGFVVRGFGGWGIVLDSSGLSLVERNYVGTNAAGTAPGPGNGMGGIVVVGSTGSTIRQNLVSANHGAGVSLVGGATNTIVEENLVGTTSAGAFGPGMGNTGSGISVSDAGTAGSGVRGNTVASSGFHGIDIVRGASGTVLTGNFVGTNSAGATGLGNNHNGVRVEQGAHHTTIGSTAPGDRNVISGNGICGVTLALGPSGPATSGNIIQGNYIGTTPGGDAALPNVGHGVSISGASGTNIVKNLISGNGGTGVWIGSNTSSTAIRGNHIGTNATGTVALPNDKGVEVAPGAGGPEIGGLVEADRNVISGNTTWGIGINQDVSDTRIWGNYIGTNETGAAPVGNGRGLVVFGTATKIGGLVAGARNVISGNAGMGIEFGSTATGNFVYGNYIGVDQAGSTRLANGANGVYIDASASGNYIGGADAGAGNVVSGNLWTGVMVYGSSNFVQGNTVGLNAVGTAAVPNGDATHTAFGIHVAGGANNLIGGTVAAARNVVSGNRGSGIYVTGAGATGNLIKGNYAGLDVTGTIAIPNATNGIDIWGSNNTVGGTSTADRNVASGNQYDGIAIQYGSGNRVNGNYAGTNAAGTAAVPNGNAGIFLNNASGNTIGKTIGKTIGEVEPGAGNLASGNASVGIYVAYSSSGNTVSGNLVGTNATGTAAIANQTGVMIAYGAHHNTVGGATSDDRNLISGNTWYGVLLEGSPSTTANTVQGNFIGTQVGGVSPLPNRNGVLIHNPVYTATNGPSTNTVVDNLIANSTNVGIVAEQGVGNRFLGNTISNSASGLAVDLWPTGALSDGATPNDPLDADTGANNLQNHPELAWADNAITAGQTTVQLSFNSTANTMFTLQFFANAACSPPARPAENPIATFANVYTGSGGNVTQTSFALPLIPPGGGVTVMATGTDGTSEVSACVPVINGTPLDLAVLNTNDSGPGSLRQTILDANSHPGADYISFSLPGPSFTVPLTSALPGITGPVTIDGWTQPGHSTGGPPVVEVRGNDTIAQGFSVTGSGTTIRGLVINAFGYGITANGSSNLRVEGNYVGTDLSGTARVPNRLGGVFIWNSTNAEVVGNLISGQGTIELPARVDGMQISECSGTRIQDNRIGTNAAATDALGNAGFGIVVAGAGTAGTVITDNVISGNPFGGISIQSGAHGTIVQSNKIGTGTDTAVEIGNGKTGFVDGGGVNVNDAPGNTIENNTIAHNLGPGVFGRGVTSTGNQFLDNAIWDNGGMGIDLWGDSGVTANSSPETVGRQNFPVITSASTSGGTTVVGGTLTSAPSNSFTIQVFSNAACDWAGGNGEGAHLMGSFTVTTNAEGEATFTETLPSLPRGGVLTAMATGSTAGGSTSEFSACYTIPAAPITFAGLTTQGSPVTTYTESWFTVTTDSPDWVTSTTYGAPAPFIYFSAPEGTTVTREIHVTAEGSAFSFRSVDLYSSTTPIPYEITGLRNSAEVFSMTGTIPNTYGAFRTVERLGLDTIDTLVIRLSNPAAPCCSNPMGLDNIVLRER